MLFKSDGQSEPAAHVLAKGFTTEAFAEYDRTLTAAYDAIQRFWFRNNYTDGSPSAVGVAQPTGPEILEALGTSAETLLNLAYSRIQYAIGSAQFLDGATPADPANLRVPYDCVFNEDGSLQSATPAEWYADYAAEHDETPAAINEE